jgi:hypothetical protein
MKEMMWEFHQFQHRCYAKRLKMSTFENLTFKIGGGEGIEVTVEMMAEVLLITTDTTIWGKSEKETDDDQEDNILNIYLSPLKETIKFTLFFKVL